MKNKLKKQNGITLISLVITVIVLLMLAGVTINLTIGQDGILKRAEQAGQEYKDAEANEITQLSLFEASIIPGKVAKIVDGVQYVGDGRGNLIPVPVGFSYLEGNKSTGFVIKNDTDRNEFVWVPCTIDGEDESIKYDRYAFTGNSLTQVLDTTTGEIKQKQGTSTYVFTEVMPNDEESSIRTYGGYYIGRYETGIADYTSQDTSTTNTNYEYTGYTGGKAVIQQNQQVWNYITRDMAKKVSEELYKKSNGDGVNSKLCSSYAWDTALKFIETKYPTYSTNSTQGNYLDKSAQLGKPAKTGVTEAVNNIYDMGGNTWEWTTETFNRDTSFGTFRGCGCYDSSNSGSAAFRGFQYTSRVTNDLSFRITLYL